MLRLSYGGCRPSVLVVLPDGADGLPAPAGAISADLVGGGGAEAGAAEAGGDRIPAKV